MSDVSCRALFLYFAELRRRGMPDEALVEGTAFELGALRDGSRRIPWDDFAALSERMGGLVGGHPALVDMGRSMLDVPAYQRLGTALRLAVGPVEIYQVSAGLLGRWMFRVPELEIVEQDRGRLHVRVRIPAPHRPSPEFFSIFEGVLEAYPRAVVPEFAIVERRPGTEREARYDVRTPPVPTGLWSRFKRRVSLLWSVLWPSSVVAETLARDDEWQLLTWELAERRSELERRVAELERMREEVTRSEALYRSLADSAPDVVLRLDRDGVVRYANRPRHRLSPLLGQRILAVLPPDEHEAVTQMLRGVMDRGERADHSTTVPDGNGGLRTYQARVAPIINDGQITGATIIARDVTDQRRVAEERLELERQLLHAQKLESLGLLAGGIAHDFNNLLVGVRANVEMLLLDETIESEDARRRLRRAARASTRAAELTDRILAYSGRPPFVVRPFDMSSLVEELGDLLLAALPKTVRVDRALEPGLPAVEGDPAQIQQVAMNLITNAAEAMEGREGTVRVRTGSRQVGDGHMVENLLSEPIRPGRYVVLEVADEGPGLDPGVRARMFDPFFSTKGQGRGLGLSTVIGIVRGHAGALEVETMPGRGTTFRAWFPACDAEARTSREYVADLPSGEGRGVLVVDDEEIVRQTAADLLDAYGFRVLVAADGQEALAVVAADPASVDVVLLDWSMPGMSGADVFAALRARWPEIPVVLCSAYDLHDELEDLWPAGLAAFVRKPWFGRQLAEVLRSRARLAPSWS